MATTCLRLLMLVTADLLQAFMGVSEHNEGYIDGGLFSMSLLYSLGSVWSSSMPIEHDVLAIRQMKRPEAAGCSPTMRCSLCILPLGISGRPQGFAAPSDSRKLDRVLLN